MLLLQFSDEIKNHFDNGFAMNDQQFKQNLLEGSFHKKKKKFKRTKIENRNIYRKKPINHLIFLHFR